MNSVIFKRVSIKNFLSIGNEPVVVDLNPGLNIITGNNRDKEDRRNGVGKSSVADAINFAIFGRTLRDINNDNIPNSCTVGRCEVSLMFDVLSPTDKKSYKIIRSLNPSKIELEIDGKDATLDTISNNNSYISKLLNSSQEVFDNCVIMTLNNTLPFMGKEKKDKRKFIESIFNLEVFNKMLTQAKTEHSDLKRSYDVVCGKLAEINAIIKSFTLHESSFAVEKIKRIEKENAKIVEYRKNVKALTESYQKLKGVDFDTKITETKTASSNTLLEKQKYDNLVVDYNKLIAVYDVEISTRQKAIGKIASNINECPVCLRQVTEADRAHIDNERKRLEKEIEGYVSKKQETNKLIKECSGESLRLRKINDELIIKVAGIEKLQKQSTELKNQIDEVNKSILQVEERIKEIGSETNTYSEMIEEQKKKTIVFDESIKVKKEDIQLLDHVKFVLSEEGIKSYLIKRILDILNGRLSYYLGKLDANCVCTFNEYFEECIINDKGKPCSYYNFSGAERKSIDLACLFTFMDLRRLQGDVTFNISMYDELLDSSLDEKGIELVLDILRERIEKYKESIFVISHRKESAKFATGDVIMLEKHNGITRRVAFNPVQSN